MNEWDRHTILHLQIRAERLKSELDKLTAERDALKARCERLEKALRMFAETDNWSTVNTDDGWTMEAWNDRGLQPWEHAQQALESK